LLTINLLIIIAIRFEINDKIVKLPQFLSMYSLVFNTEYISKFWNLCEIWKLHNSPHEWIFFSSCCDDCEHSSRWVLISNYNSEYN